MVKKWTVVDTLYWIGVALVSGGCALVSAGMGVAALGVGFLTAAYLTDRGRGEE